MFDLESVKVRRLKLGLNQKELALLAGVSQSLIAKLERGKLDPSFSKAKSILEALEAKEHDTGLKASDVMSRKLFLLSPNDFVSKAVSMMRKEGISQIPVFDSRLLVGSVSERVLLNAMSESRMTMKDLLKLRISEVMSKELFPIVNAKMPLHLISEMLKYNPAVLVSQANKVVGIVTTSDLLVQTR